MASSLRASALTLLVALAAAGCTVKDSDPPPPSGPSELGTSLALAASPDVLTQDGHSQSQVAITARDANGQPIRSLGLRVEIAVAGVVQDYGRLSSKNVTTGTDGRAVVTYTAPESVDSVDRHTLVSIQATPSSTDARATVPRSVDIRLVPSGVITPPGPEAPEFTFTPENPTVLETVVFTAPHDTNLTSYAWSFGDDGTASGRNVQYQYRTSGNYMVTLTVRDATGAQGSRSKPISVGEGTRPTASFVYSPDEPGIGTEIFFNASASTAAAGRRIVSYDWDFGTGRTGSGMVIAKRYDTPGTYNVTLTVTDDAGLKGTASEGVTVSTTGTGSLVSSFVYSPTSPTAGQTVNFNAAQSTSSDDAIVDYSWDFGDGSRQNGSSPLVSHKYVVTGAYVAILTVKDNKGRTSTTQQTITVGE